MRADDLDCVVRLELVGHASRLPGRLALAVAVVALLAACGGSAHRGAQREWVANAGGLIDQLSGDVVLSDPGGGLASARRALHDDSELYGLLIAYTDFGGCGHMLAAVGPAPVRYRRVEPPLREACGSLERASTLFGRAAKGTDAHALLAASRAVRRAEPLLFRARLQLELSRRR